MPEDKLVAAEIPASPTVSLNPISTSVQILARTTSDAATPSRTRRMVLIGIPAQSDANLATSIVAVVTPK